MWSLGLRVLPVGPGVLRDVELPDDSSMQSPVLQEYFAMAIVMLPAQVSPGLCHVGNSLGESTVPIFNGENLTCTVDLRNASEDRHARQAMKSLRIRGSDLGRPSLAKPAAPTHVVEKMISTAKNGSMLRRNPETVNP
jgi:hypothetical protein